MVFRIGKDLFHNLLKVMSSCCFLIFLFNQALASNFCENPSVHRNIECCLSDSFQCNKLIDSNSPEFHYGVHKVLRNFHKGHYQEGDVPNCFWAALEFSGLSFSLEPSFVSAAVFENMLEKNFREISLREAVYGDVVVYFAEQDFYHDLVMVEGFPIEVMVHAAVFLGEGFVLQKENRVNGVFSISTLEESFQGYERASLAMGARGFLKRFYRLNIM